MAIIGRHRKDAPAATPEPPPAGMDLVESLPPITPATPADTGCWLGGVYGWHNTYRIIDTAIGRGMPITAEDEAALDMYRESGESIDDGWMVGEMAEEALTWLNENVAPPGHLFTWHEGDLMMWSEAQYCTASGDKCWCVEPHD